MLKSSSRKLLPRPSSSFDAWRFSTSIPIDRQSTTYARERLSSCAAGLNLRIVSAATVVRIEGAGEHWCAVGDALLSHDPLSGCGVYDAPQSARRAASAIEDYLHRGKPLRAYKSWTAARLRDYLHPFVPEVVWRFREPVLYNFSLRIPTDASTSNISIRRLRAQ